MKVNRVSPRVFSLIGIVFNACYHHFWIRFKFIGWRGFILKDIRLYPLLFSERSGFTKIYFLRLWWVVVPLKSPFSHHFLDNNPKGGPLVR